MTVNSSHMSRTVNSSGISRKGYLISFLGAFLSGVNVTVWYTNNVRGPPPFDPLIHSPAAIPVPCTDAGREPS
jgi:hypothetical protein